MSDDRLLILFKTSNGAYVPGDRATFRPERAHQLVKSGVAEFINPKDRVSVLDDEKSGGVDTRTHDLSNEQVIELFASIDNIEELEELWAGEMQHPDHKGGRKGVKTAARTRAEEIKNAP